jgi:hypothetical protein
MSIIDVYRQNFKVNVTEPSSNFLTVKYDNPNTLLCLNSLTIDTDHADDFVLQLSVRQGARSYMFEQLYLSAGYLIYRMFNPLYLKHQDVLEVSRYDSNAGIITQVNLFGLILKL